MLDRMTAGEIPPKPHTALRDGAGTLRHEECLTRDGFDGPFTIMYHADRPHTAAVANAGHGWEIPEAVDDALRPLARRHYRSQELARRGGPPIDARVPLLFNDDVVISIAHPDEADPVYFANGDGDDLYFIVDGGGVLRSVLGDVRFAARDYVFVPKGLLHRFVPHDRPQVWLSIECAAGFGLPRQWRNEVGQLRMDAPYSHRDFRRPSFDGPRDEGLRDLVVKRGDAFHGFHHAHAPLDVVGWDGAVYPWAFPILNFQPRVGLVHLPPTVHGTFATRGALICSFVPRPLDF
ncbi:MAG TPA: homogentisate 1,2-dioxygenase, partial [Polyangia bacterium]|nr:homogentisate 1,2-dioxygenase [Polyangia bacterium]